MKNYFIIISCLFLSSLFWQGCDGQQESNIKQVTPVLPVSEVQLPVEPLQVIRIQSKLPINCFILKPIPRNTFYNWKGIIPSDTSLVAFIKKIPTSKTIQVDTNALELLSFERQQRILLNNYCIDYLEKPDTIGLSYLYSSSRFTTSERTRSNIEFLDLYEDNIFNFGQAYIYEYRLHGGSRVEPTYVHIIIPDKSKNSFGNEYDYEGIVLYSDGLEWQQVNDKVIPVHMTILRSGMEIKVPLVFDGAQFIPVKRFRKD